MLILFLSDLLKINIYTMNCTPADTGGYDVEFAENILSTSLEDIKCAICLLILKEPLQANPCGHRFCKTCIERVPGFGYV